MKSNSLISRFYGPSKTLFFVCSLDKIVQLIYDIVIHVYK